MQVEFNVVNQLAINCGAVRVEWRLSDVSESGAIAEVFYERGDRKAHQFFGKMANVCERMIRVRTFDNWLVGSIPCECPGAEIRLGWASRGGKVILVKG